MASLYSKNYDPQKDSGTSGAETSDLNPGSAYDTDLRRVEPEQRFSVEGFKTKENQVEKYMRAAKSANKFRQSALISEPSIRGKTPIGKSYTSSSPYGGTELPSLRGRNYGDPGAGGTEYAHKPKGYFGRFYGFS